MAEIAHALGQDSDALEYEVSALVTELSMSEVLVS